MAPPLPRQVLNYHDVQLYDSDVALFAPGQWLNDNTINFYFQFLFQSLCVATSSSAKSQLQQTHDVRSNATASDVLFVDPAIVSCMMLQCDDDVEFQELGTGLDIDTKQLCFIPVNDNDAFGGESSHWSLLVYHRAAHSFAHYDSSDGLNTRAAKRIAHTFNKMLRLCRSANAAVAPQQQMTFTSVGDAPQQPNGYDCGMFVLVVAEFLCRGYAERFEDAMPRSLHAFATAEQVTRMRQTMPALIQRLQREQQQDALVQ